MNKYIKSNILIATTIFIVAIGGCTKADRNDDVVKGDPPPVPGGFTNSSQVATSNLLAYWSFDTDKRESKSGAFPSLESNATFTTGIKGQGILFNQGYMTYPAFTALAATNAIGSVTVSAWVKFANTGTKLTSFLSIARDSTVENDWLSIVNMGSETGNHPPSDENLYLHSWIGSFANGNRSGGDNINDFGNAGVDYQKVPSANKWVQYILRYDGATSIIDLFANNTRVSNNNFRVRTGLGPLIYNGNKRVILGSFPNTSAGFTNSPTLGFHGLLQGSMDEVRIYNKALTDAEINALYILEKQGR